LVSNMSENRAKAFTKAPAFLYPVWSEVVQDVELCVGRNEWSQPHLPDGLSFAKVRHAAE
jgi:hypothetical protein